MPQSKDRKEYMKELMRQRRANKAANNDAESVSKPVSSVKSLITREDAKEARILVLRGLLDQAKAAYTVEQRRAIDAAGPSGMPDFSSLKLINAGREDWFEELHELEGDRPGHAWMPARIGSESLEVVKRK